MPTDTLNCPQCGNVLPLTFSFSKLTVCNQCDSTIFLEDEGARLAGTQSTLTDLPSLIQLKMPFTYKTVSYLPVGHIRYSYGQGFWDEWWIMDNKGEGVWMSVDEGDFAFEYPKKLQGSLPRINQLRLDQTVRVMDKDWKVTEIGRATCEGFQGELPEIIEAGEQFDYIHLSAQDAALMTLEYFGPHEVYGYQGQWVDPFDIRIDQ
ncbi:MAG: Unknown protein [uncultured Thiotrichaceae bacterium]|uniref:DUF4178 domain-containing protein n=1 Tax=uncultured Thiotrichaceae bacterium TaxID=298394 RepID=A0A6S6TCD6_9GAMM|nr:MAG: Unknown protein [uncultured Thiotrichaceae bacterium]